jgi:macrolide transport system ATP-binding/permease protein
MCPAGAKEKDMKELLQRVRYWCRRRRADSELAEEIEFHRALKQEELERAGLDPGSAAAESRRQLGNTLRAREQSRDVWGWTWIDDTVRDIHYAARTLARAPLLAVVVIISVGVGIGVNAAVFSWIQAVVLQPLPGVDAPSSFYRVEPRSDTGSYPGASWLEYNDLKPRLTSFQEVLAFRMVPLNVGEADRTERKYGLLVSGNYFSALGLRPALGRFTAAEEASTRSREVVISHGIWQTQFGGKPDVIGQSVRVNDQILSIIGVVPEGFQGTVVALDFDFWLPASVAPDLFNGTRELEDRNQRGYNMMGRLRPQASRVQAQSELNAAMRQLAQEYPENNARLEAEILPYWQAPRGPQRMLVTGLAILQGLMFLLLLAICGNTANLLLARAAARTREVGTRLAIGATRWRIIRLLMTENLLLGLFGAALGILIAVWGTDALRAVRVYSGLPIRLQTSVDLTGVLVSVSLGIGAAIVFGLVPALQLVRGDPQAKLRTGSSASPHVRLRKVFIAIEAALALMVLVAAGLFFESFQDTRSVDPGFKIEGVLLAQYDLTVGGIGHFQRGGRVDPALSRRFADRLLERLQAVPGVESAAIASAVPLDIHGFPMASFKREGKAQADAGDDRGLFNFVTPGYFRTMGIPIVAGADFAALNDATTPTQAIVNEEFVRRYPLGAEPVGQRIGTGNNKLVIAGVVKNSFYDSFGEAPIPIVYFSYRDRPRAYGQIHLRTRPGAETLLAGEVRRAVREIEPELVIFDVRTLGEHVEGNLFLRRIPARLFVVLGPLLLFFAAIGIYSVVAYNVAHRVTEIGIRMALGATGANVIAQIIGETIKVIAYGAVAGLAIAFIAYIHVVPGGPIDPRVFLGIPVILLLVAIAACWLPARRAAGLDPLTALRQQ